jgi:hypothetical protein
MRAADPGLGRSSNMRFQESWYTGSLWRILGSPEDTGGLQEKTVIYHGPPVLSRCAESRLNTRNRDGLKWLVDCYPLWMESFIRCDAVKLINYVVSIVSFLWHFVDRSFWNFWKVARLDWWSLFRPQHEQFYISRPTNYWRRYAKLTKMQSCHWQVLPPPGK